MSRRNHHGGRRHSRPHRPAERRPTAPPAATPGAPLDAAASPPAAVEDVLDAGVERAAAPPSGEVPEVDAERAPATVPEPREPAPRVVAAFVEPAPPVERSEAQPPNGGELAGIATATCTAPQLRRFIKSRAYVPMHELRRRFGINGPEDDVTPIDVNSRRVYVGLPEREGRLLGDLLRGGDVGFELSLDPISPIVVGVYPMRPVPRV